MCVCVYIGLEVVYIGAKNIINGNNNELALLLHTIFDKITEDLAYSHLTCHYDYYKLL